MPWESTLQASLTLALANPVLWYLIDGTRPGFALSALVGFAGTILLLLVNPDIVPAPTGRASGAVVGTASGDGATASHGEPVAGGTWASISMSTDTLGMWTWIASVLFCSSICFGNIGRRLAPARTRRPPPVK